MMKNPYALGFSAAIFLYVAVECAVYVWMPTLLATCHGSATFMAAYAISIFFILRAAGRFIGSWILGRLNWAAVVTIFSMAIFACFMGSVPGGSELRFSFCHCRDSSCPSFIPRSTPRASVASGRRNMVQCRASFYFSLVGRRPWGHWLWAPSATPSVAQNMVLSWHWFRRPPFRRLAIQLDLQSSRQSSSESGPH